MNGSYAEIAAAFAGGAAVGAFFLGSLWWTVRRLARTSRRGPWIALSSGLRIGVSVLGLYLVSGGEGPRLLAALGGFVVLRAAAAPLLGAWKARGRPREGPDGP